MNRWRILLSGVTVLLFHLLILVHGSGEIRQRSDGCGRNPLIALAAVFVTTTTTPIATSHSSSYRVGRGKGSVMFHDHHTFDDNLYGSTQIIFALDHFSFGSGNSNLNDVLRAVKANPDVWSEMQVLLRRYDDCIRAGDGLHYKRNFGLPFSFPAPSPSLYAQLQPMYDTM